MKDSTFEKWSFYFVLFILVLIVFSPVYYLNAYDKSSSDFPLHALYAADLKENGVASLPAFTIAHSAWQYILVFVNWVTGFTFQKSGFLVAVLATEITSLVLFLWFWPAFINKQLSMWKSLAIILGISIAAPITLLWNLDGLMYLGYIGITTYHSPTIILLKSFALLQFILAYKCFDDSSPLENSHIFIAGIVSLLAAYIKPSLAICILPALGVFTAYRLLQKKYVNLFGLIFGFVVPSVLLLVWQFLVTYYANDTGSVMFFPLGVMSIYSNYLLPKLLLSISFPLLVLVIYFRQIKLDDRMLIAWLIFGFGAFFTYFFAEGGARIMDGNFGWSGEISLMILFIVSTLFYLEVPRKQAWINAIVEASWFLHIVFGVAYYFYCIYNSTYI